MTNVIKVALSSRVAVDTVETESKSSPKIKATTTTTKNKRRAVMKAIRIHQQAIWPPPTPKYLMAAVPVTLMALFLLSIPAQAFYHQLPPVISGLESPGAGGQRPIEYQLIGEAGQPIRLPCLIGKQLYCGEPYFIAWYKLNMSSKSWVRFEHKSMEDSDLIDSIESSGSASVQLAPSSIAMMTGQPLANRVRFDWSPPRGGDSRQPTAKSANFKSSICSDPAIYHSTVAVNNPARQLLSEQATNFDCAQLTISSLELPDEGQYKCEITFSESLDFDKCPATTLSQLTVIARPTEPELLVNGRKTSPSGVGGIGLGVGSSNLAFKEGSQVKLECQSSGGKPAPRIEWLNQLRDQQQLASGAHYSLEQLVKNPVHLLRMLNGSPANGQQQLHSLGLMFKRIKLDVQVRPTSVSLIVRDVYSSSSLLEPVQFAGLETASASSSIGAPFYTLQLNRLYAIQCLVEQSRPQSQVSWFNRSVPIAVEPLELSSGSSSSSYFIVPNELAQLRPNYNNPPHRLSSFVRHELLPDGASFRTTATLLLTTSLWDNFEELSCRISNEAFQLEELPQPAPIRLFVNYSPFAWLELDSSRMNQEQQQQQIEWAPNGWLAKVQAATDSELSLRCSVAANPLGQNTILQIEWLKDGRKLQQPAQISSSSNKQQASKSRLQIERANHLHMPLVGASASAAAPASGNKNGPNQLVSGSKLIGSSWLSISPLNKSDSANYTCQFKLIPAPPSNTGGQTTHPNAAHHQTFSSSSSSSMRNEIRITSGQANQTIQVNVIEVGPRMLERRELLMPQMRSFSELELSANPANKLRLVCLAQCEPLCSIEWYLNQEPLVAAAAVASTSAAVVGLQDSAASGGLVNRSARINLAAEAGFVHRQELQAASLPWFRLVSTENVIHQQQPIADAYRNTSSGGGGRFSWLRQTSLGAIGGHPSLGQLQQLDWLGRQLMREASEQQYLPDQVNVFSRLELSYNTIVRLLEAAGGQTADLVTRIKCRVNPIFDSVTSGGFEHTYLGPNQWSNGVEAEHQPAARRRNKLVAARPPATNLSSLFPAPAAASADPSDHFVQLSAYSSSLSAADRRLSFVDEMQISLLLDKAPASVSIWFAGVLSTDLEPNGVTLSESQLHELADPNRVAPLLQCKVLGHSPQPAVKFKWTFVDWNNTELPLVGDVSQQQQQQLNLRQLIELRQTQLNAAEPSMLAAPTALGLDVVLSSIVGNYSCTASNIHGSKSATMPIRIQGRPICKLALASQFLGPDNELLANLRCTIYSVAPLIETSWFRNEQQLATIGGSAGANKTPTTSRSASSAISTVDLPVMVLNKQQEFLLADLLSTGGGGGGGGGNLKCVAKNAFGSSDGCELNQASKQMLLNTLRPFGTNGLASLNLGGGKNSPLSMVSYASDSLSNSKQSINSLPATNQTYSISSSSSSSNNNNNNNNIDIGTSSAANQAQPGSSSEMIFRLFRFDWLIIICSSLAGLWLLFILNSAFVRRKFKLSSCASGGGSPRTDRDQHNTSWRFNSSSSRSNSNNEIVGVPFQGSKVCVNYYGGADGSNGADSEHEMKQSGSQSSHYEDFVQHQLLLKQQQHQQQQLQQRLISQPVYLNGLSTLNRPMKSSLSSSSTCDSSTNSRLGVKKLLTSQTVMRSDQLSGSYAHHNQQKQPPPSTMRNSFVGGGGGGCGSNVPLVNGSNTSRVNLDQQQQQLMSVAARHYHHPRQAQLTRSGHSMEQQLYGPTRNEHIYDDVIYNQMIL